MKFQRVSTCHISSTPPLMPNWMENILGCIYFLSQHPAFLLIILFIVFNNSWDSPASTLHSAILKRKKTFRSTLCCKASRSLSNACGAGLQLFIKDLQLLMISAWPIIVLQPSQHHFSASYHKPCLPFREKYSTTHKCNLYSFPLHSDVQPSPYTPWLQLLSHQPVSSSILLV